MTRLQTRTQAPIYNSTRAAHTHASTMHACTVTPAPSATTHAKMNYRIAALFAAVILVASVQWAVDSRKTFKVPKVVVLEGEVGGREVVTGRDVGTVGLGEGKSEKGGV